MKLKQLKKCLDLIGFWISGNKKVIETLNSETNIIEKIFRPTKKELIKNVLLKESKEGKEGVIRYYISEFGELNMFFKKHLKASNKEQNDFASYIIKSHTVYDMMLNEIQLICQTHSIDFFSLCHDLNFELNYIDSGITLAFEEKNSKSQTQKSQLTIDQIALKHVYEGIQITRQNGNQIVQSYGYNSGEKLFQRYIFYSSVANRKAKPTPCTPKRLKNKIILLESVITLLPESLKNKAIGEVEVLKTIYESEF